MCHVLVVDKDPVQHFLAEYLSRQTLGIGSLKCFLNPAEALDYISERSADPLSLPDVILLDMDMPLIDGPGFLNIFRQITKSSMKKIAVFVISSSVNPYHKSLVEQYSFVKGFYSKPLTKTLLEELVSVDH